MTEPAAQRIWLAHALEAEDRDGALVPVAERAAAGQAAKAALGDGGGEASAWIAARAERLTALLTARHPLFATLERRSRWPGWVVWVVPLAALAAGLLTNELDNGRRLNLIAFPLIGTLAWNIAVVLLTPLGWWRGRTGANGMDRPGPARGPVGWWRRAAERAAPAQGPSGAVARRFLADWSRVAAPLANRRLALALHLGAAAFAAGLVGGMYLRALGVEYRAGWESTFLSAEAVRALLGTVLGPASALSGIGLPDAAGVASLRWPAIPQIATGAAAVAGGAPAGPWIHLYAVTAALFAIGPRLALAAIEGARILAARRAIALPTANLPVMRRWLREHRGGRASVRLIPYAHQPDAEAVGRWTMLLTDALGQGTVVTVDPAVDYGAEDAFIDRFAPAGEATGAGAGVGAPDHLLLLYNLGATPEAENHGAFLTGIAAKAAAAGQPAPLALVDGDAFAQRLGTGAGAAARLKGRADAWRSMVQGLGHPVLIIRPSQADAATVAALEAALAGAAPPATPVVGPAP